MRTRRIILVTALGLLAVAILGGILGYDRLEGLGERQQRARALVAENQALRRLAAKLDESAAVPRSFLAGRLTALEAMQPREPLRLQMGALRQAIETGDRGQILLDLHGLQEALAGEIEQTLRRAGERAEALGEDLLQIALVGGPLLAALAAGSLLTTIYLPLRRAGRARNAVAAAEAVSGVSSELAELLRDVDAERRARVMDLMRTGHLAALGTFAAGIAHEVRNPLTAVAGTAEAALRRLREGVDSEGLALEKALIRIESESHRAGKLLGDILRLAPLESGEPERFDTVYEVKEAVALVAARWRVDEEAFGLRSPAALVIEGRPAMFRQILFNLLTNAVEASREAGTLTPGAMSLTVESAQGGVSVTVKDRGAGFSADVAERLFEPFFSTRGKDGTGLGLFLCEGLLREAGGSIRATSAGPKLGAEFRFFLPSAASSKAEEGR